MSQTIKVQGPTELKDRIERFAASVKRLEGEHTVSINDLFTESFLRSCSRFSSFEEMVRESGLVNWEGTLTNEIMQSIPDEDWDNWVKQETTYPCWKEMLVSAEMKYIMNRVDLEGE